MLLFKAVTLGGATSTTVFSHGDVVNDRFYYTKTLRLTKLSELTQPFIVQHYIITITSDAA